MQHYNNKCLLFKNLWKKNLIPFCFKKNFYCNFYELPKFNKINVIIKFVDLQDLKKFFPNFISIWLFFYSLFAFRGTVYGLKQFYKNVNKARIKLYKLNIIINYTNYFLYNFINNLFILKSSYDYGNFFFKLKICENYLMFCFNNEILFQKYFYDHNIEIEDLNNLKIVVKIFLINKNKNLIINHKLLKNLFFHFI